MEQKPKNITELEVKEWNELDYEIFDRKPFHREVLKFYKNFSNKEDEEEKQFIYSLNEHELSKICFDYRGIIMKPVTFDNISFRSTTCNRIRYTAEEVVSYISNYYELNHSQIKVINNNHIRICIPIKGKNLQLIEKDMDICHYQIIPFDKRLYEYQFKWIEFAPEILPDDTETIRKEECVLLHLTPFHNIGKIKNIGFSPNCNNEIFNYARRSYFLRGSFDSKDIENIVMQLNKALPETPNYKLNGIYALFKLDVNKIPKDVVLWFDNDYPYGIFTEDYIPKDAIIEVNKLILE